jgi:hypothetical protein
VIGWFAPVCLWSVGWAHGCGACRGGTPMRPVVCLEVGGRYQWNNTIGGGGNNALR